MSHLARGERFAPAEAVLTTIERQAGARPPGCPWRAWEEPEVTEVLDLYYDAHTGEAAHVASLYPVDPPAHLLEGVRWYRSCTNRMRAAEQKRREAEREQKSRTSGPR